jgi:hypothetical protein
MKTIDHEYWKDWKITNHDGMFIKILRVKSDYIFPLDVFGRKGGHHACIYLTAEIARELAKDLLEAADMAGE